MRTALIAADQRTDTGALRAGLLLAGRSVLEWQVELAQTLGCERIICLCEAPGAAVLDVQKQVEAAGGDFHALRGTLKLVGLVRADDELVMLRDGLVIDPALALELACEGDALRKGVLTLPASHVLAEDHPEDFERIDRDRSWAGLAIMGAGQVQKLADLPPDGDVMSLLLRLALQARVECRELPLSVAESDGWMLATGTEALARRERALIDASAAQSAWTGPGRALAATTVRRIAPRWLESGVEVSAIGTVLLMVSGFALAAMGYGTAGLGLAALAALGGAFAESWARLRSALWPKARGGHVRAWIGLFVDLASVGVLTVALATNTDQLPILALPAITIGLARYCGSVGEGKIAVFWRDRALHLAMLAITAPFGLLGEALALFGLGAIAQLLMRKGPV